MAIQVPGKPQMPAAAPGAAEAATGAGAGGPTAAPMTTPQPMEGLEKAGRVKVQVVAKQLQQLVPSFPYDSKESKALIDVLKKLADAFGKSADEDSGLMKSETLSMLGLMGNKTPGQGAMAARPPMAPPGAGAPPPTPPAGA